MAGSIKEVFKTRHYPVELVDLFVKNQNCLTYILIWYIFLANNNFDWISQNVRTKFFYLLLESCWKKESLSIWSDLRYDRPDLIFKTHTKHLISFIYDKKSTAASEIKSLLPNHFNQSARCRDYYFVLTSFDILPKLMLVYPSKNGKDINIESTAHLPIYFINLVA